jgi:hypothetical protein
MLLRRKCLGTVAYAGGIPFVHEPFCRSWGALREYTAVEMCGPGEYVHFEPTAGRKLQSFHPFIRNEFAADFQGDWLFMLDCDHSFDPDLLARMLRTAAMGYEGQPIGVLTGLYTSRYPPYGPVLFGQHEGVDFGIAGMAKGADGKPRDDAPPVFRVAAAGAGCLLVQRWVFERIWNELRQPPFAPIPTEPERTTLQLGCYSEDRSFFWRCNALKIPVYVDYRIECHHLMTRPLGIADFQEDAVQITVINAERNGEKPSGVQGEHLEPGCQIGNLDSPIETNNVSEVPDLDRIAGWAGQ